jgi:energy-coupling factor transport system permease protein
MYWVTGGFIFRRVESRFHQLDPRTRLLISLEFFIISLAASSIIQIVTILSAIIFVAAIAKSLKRIGRTIAFSAGFAAFIFFINFIFGIGVLNSFIFAFRFLAIISSTSIFFVTTSPDELELTMKWMKVPRDIVFAFATAVRFIPVIMLDALQIMDAQKSRGLELEKGNLLRRVRNLVPILVPLVVNSVIRSGELAEAMESRAYGATSKPTSLYELILKWYDKVVIASSLGFFLTILYIYLQIPMPL